MPLDVRIASLPDMAISELKEPLSVPLLSNQVIMQNGEVLIQEGMPKLSLFSTHSKISITIIATLLQEQYVMKLKIQLYLIE